MDNYDETYEYFLADFFPNVESEQILRGLRVEALGYAQVVRAASEMINSMMVQGEFDIEKLVRLNHSVLKNSARLLAMFDAGAAFEKNKYGDDE